MRVHPLRRAMCGFAAVAATTALVAGSLAAPAQAKPTTKEGLNLDKLTKAQAIPDKWLVQVKGSPALRGGSHKAATSAQTRVKTAVKQAGVKAPVLHSYTRVWNGFAIKASKAEAQRVATLSGVAAVYPVFVVRPPERKVEAQLAYSLPTIGANAAQVSGYTGAGVKVGVIDSGIDYNHPDLGGSGTNDPRADFPNSRVQYGYDFVGDDYDAALGGTPQPDPYPDDCNGHGTHVAGIIGANGDTAAGHVKGVAPKVTFGAYRVLSCEGSTDTEVILAAMDMAAADGMDVVNMSLGSDFSSWPDYPEAAAATALAEAGTIVVAASGNAGESGLFSVGAPSVGKSAISVGSVENTTQTNWVFRVTPGGSVQFVPAEGAPAAPLSGSSDLVRASVQDGCVPLASLTGKIALIQRGTCNFSEKALNAQAAGAVGVVLYDNATGSFTPTVAGAGVTIPVVAISQSDGNALWGQLATTPTKLTWVSETAKSKNPEAGAISGFSSFGLAADLTLEPDLSAPGGNIWSTYPVEKRSYANLSGTSMASPHVAGAVALMLQATKMKLKGNVSAIRTALTNTATPVKAQGLKYSGYESAAKQGAGLIHVDRAIAALTQGSSVTPGKLSLGENRSKYYAKTLKVTNRSKKTVKYKLSVTNSLNVGAAPTTEFYGYNNKKVKAKFSKKTLTVKAGKTAKVKVYLKQPSLKTGWIYGGWVKLTPTNGSQQLVVPFAGMYGDYQKVKVLQDWYDLGSNGRPYRDTKLPALGALVEGNLVLLGSNANPVYNLSGGNMPYIAYHLDYPANRIDFNVYKATSKGKKGAEVFRGYKTFYREGKVGRDDDAQVVAFDGKIPFNSVSSSGLTVPNGRYVIEIRVLKALGSAKKASHWETWLSPAFTIDRARP